MSSFRRNKERRRGNVPIPPKPDETQLPDEQQQQQQQQQQQEQVPAPQPPRQQRIEPDMRQHLDDMRRQEEIIRRRQEETRCYLISINYGDGTEKVMVGADDLMVALVKFAQVYHNECADFAGLMLNIEEVDYIE